MSLIVCNSCGEEKELEHFHRVRSTSELREKRCKECKVRQAREQRHKDPSKYKIAQRARDLKHKYGIDDDHYRIVLMQQGFKCFICGRDNPGRKDVEHFMIDHDHETGSFRGLLCQPCNVNLGWFEKYKQKIFSHLNLT